MKGPQSLALPRPFRPLASGEGHPERNRRIQGGMAPGYSGSLYPTFAEIARRWRRSVDRLVGAPLVLPGSSSRKLKEVKGLFRQISVRARGEER